MKNFIADFGKMLVRLGGGFHTSSLSSFQKWTCLRDTLRRLEINCVLDVGANEGQFAETLRRIGYQGQIISFEPIKEVFAHLSKRFAKDNQWQGMNIALGATDSIKEFNVATDSSAMSSFLNPKHGWDLQTETVEVRRLDSIFGDLVNTVQKPHVFLKIDTQGYDLEVIKGTTGCIQNILGIQSELSVQQVYIGAPHFLEALTEYERLGFGLVGLYEIFRSSHRVAEYDCIMERTIKS